MPYADEHLAYLACIFELQLMLCAAERMNFRGPSNSLRLRSRRGLRTQKRKLMRIIAFGVWKILSPKAEYIMEVEARTCEAEAVVCDYTSLTVYALFLNRVTIIQFHVKDI